MQEERRGAEERDRTRHNEQERGRAEQVPRAMGWVAGGCGDASWNEREPRAVEGREGPGGGGELES